jgi:antitoxin (DNA-binding transcriptional repressor) of toxin-antitoxin stability system
MNTQDTVQLKELRENMPAYIAEVAKGRSFTVIKRSKPIFQISPVADEGKWRTIVDFTEIDPRGVDADELLKYL